eukprot:10511763-Karenia_brevis.AAC.1
METSQKARQGRGEQKLDFRQSGSCGDAYFQGGLYATFNICSRATPWMRHSQGWMFSSLLLAGVNI